MSEEPVPKRQQPERKFIKQYAHKRGGTLVLNYEMIKGNRAKRVQFRWIDAILITNGKGTYLSPKELDERGLNRGDEVEFIQAKVTPLGMSLLGQSLFSRSLMNKKMRTNKWNVKSRRWITLCKQPDEELGALASDYGIDAVVREKGTFVVAN